MNQEENISKAQSSLDIDQEQESTFFAQSEQSAIQENFQPAKISENAKVVLEHRYLLKNDKGDVVEDPDGLFRRVANALAKPDKLYGSSAEEIKETAEEFYQMLSSLEFLANSPTLMNAGTKAGTLSACFVLPLEDSMEGIMKTAHDAAMVQKYGGGTGFALSELRPKGATIKTTHGKACGPIAALKLLSSVSTLVTQGGKRDGANMAVMNVHHPDIEEFVDCKTQEGEIHNFNISVGATDEFMKAVKEKKDYNLIDPKTKEVVGTKNAYELFRKIVKGAWKNGEPGMIFLDEVNRKSPVNHLGDMTATNPCGEQPLLPNESCNLGSIDLAKFVNEDETDINWGRLKKSTRTAVHFLDNTIDANKYAIPEIKKANKLSRKIGLGVMGFADMLIKMKMSYDSEEAVDMGRKVMKFIQIEADIKSEELAEKRGPFEGWEGSRPQINGDKPIRNACRLTVAPTGTISMIAGCSSGIEPVFSLAYRKQNILEGKTLYYVDKNLEKVAKEKDFYSEDLLEHLSNGGSLQDREDVPEDVKKVFRTAPDIDPEYHVRMQAAFQESVDAGISKTINFPNEASEDDVTTTYMLAWELKCKGITVYRAGSRDKEVLTSGTSENDAEETSNDNVGFVPSIGERPSELFGVTRRVYTGRGNLYVTVNMSEDGKPFEIFAALGKAGGNDSAMAEAVSRMVSLTLRSGIDPKESIEQLKGITDVPAWNEGELIRSVPDAIANVLEKIYEPKKESTLSITDLTETTLVSENQDSNISNILQGETCPECPEILAFEEGCQKCYSCGYSKC
ncbi:MAG: ribonucleoside-diphosphate reductase, adenosylcobalamin-dependent [Chloroflexi bacterium]|nr:ribonucleoside-diphosphate reductase, adenosylcobalamin-dependent [Chloroflexota bacterium]|tara:strand:- start:4080 stop:6461 length:2382 start_codon:yes stop_codon:yes gene_type:complete